jgi:hypothetical protein
MCKSLQGILAKNKKIQNPKAFHNRGFLALYSRYFSYVTLY